MNVHWKDVLQKVQKQKYKLFFVCLMCFQVKFRTKNKGCVIVHGRQMHFAFSNIEQISHLSSEENIMNYIQIAKKGLHKEGLFMQENSVFTFSFNLLKKKIHHCSLNCLFVYNAYILYTCSLPMMYCFSNPSLCSSVLHQFSTMHCSLHLTFISLSLFGS